MGRVFVVELEGRIYKCKFCSCHLAHADDLVSRRYKFYMFSFSIKDEFLVNFSLILVAVSSKQAFSCRRGKAYLFNTVVNITYGAQEERMMLSGMHTVADIFCCCCGQIVGWKYEAAHDKNQKYKEGKHVLERGRIIDGMDSEFYLDTRSGVSDNEDV
ncbi:hypothetical protein GIB67_000360 [Kingdonia uniflora]|uniref:Protein yippee-like n=1 Tax=Kingdonia uniflora TaxID=39325 RepID=A0A7J7LKH4_9MAGN|nr:hypothetical protein GIB67_000360 [Kingdonia uniflora]